MLLLKGKCLDEISQPPYALEQRIIQPAPCLFVCLSVCLFVCLFVCFRGAQYEYRTAHSVAGVSPDTNNFKQVGTFLFAYGIQQKYQPLNITTLTWSRVGRIKRQLLYFIMGLFEELLRGGKIASEVKNFLVYLKVIMMTIKFQVIISH